MKSIPRSVQWVMIGLLAVGLAGFCVRELTVTSGHAMAADGVPVSSDVAGVPARPDVALMPLTNADLAEISPNLQTAAGIDASAAAAVQTAESEFGLSVAQIDPVAGVVSAVVNPIEHPMLSDTHAWIVTADVDTAGQGLATSGITYHKLCIVISLESGKYLYAYAADPQ